MITTLCIVHQNSRVLLGMKKRGFGVGRWNGFGGKVDQSETIETAARRELTEESGVVATDIEKVAVINFTFEIAEAEAIEMHVFSVTEFSGKPVESEEMEPEWFSFDMIPYAQMWADDIEWLPHVLTGQKFTARFHLDQPATNEYASKVLSHDIDVVETIE